MDMLVKVFGGHLSKLKTHGWTYWWYRIHGKKAVIVLKKLLPYLVLKKANAQLGIAFQTLVETSQPARYEARDPEAVAMLEGFYEASKSMNRRNKPMDYTKEKSGPVVLN